MVSLSNHERSTAFIYYAAYPATGSGWRLLPWQQVHLRRLRGGGEETARLLLSQDKLSRVS